MNSSTQPDSHIRQSLLEQIASITTMRPGTLAEEYREHPSPDGQSTVRLGPYYKHQIWQDGRNVSKRVPAAEATALKHDIEQAKLFHQLTEQLAQLNYQHTIALRASEAAENAPPTPDITEKKTSKPNASPKNTKRPNTTSPKPAKHSPKKNNNKT